MTLTLGDWLGIFGLSTGVVGIILAVWFYYKGKREMEPHAILKTLRLAAVDPAIAGAVTILYDGVPVPNVRLARLVLWNAGKVPIRQSDVSPKSPFAAVFPVGARVLSHSVTASRADVNASSTTLEQQQPKVTIGFDFLAENDWIRLEVLYSAEEQAITVSGVTVGGIPLLVRNGDDLLRNKRDWFSGLVWFAVTGMFGSVVHTFVSRNTFLADTLLLITSLALTVAISSIVWRIGVFRRLVLPPKDSIGSW